MEQTPDTSAYIADCVARGMSREQIAAQLAGAGWLPESIEEALSTLPVVTEVIKVRAKWLIPVVGIVTIVTFSSISVVAAAENGYLPQVSKQYRKTMLPLLWHGTNANPEIVVGKMLEAINQNPGAENIGTYTLNISQHGTNAVSFASVPLLAAVLTPRVPLVLADISSCSSTKTSCETVSQDAPFPSPDKLLPASISLSLTSKHNTLNDTSIMLGLDIGDLASKLAPLKTQGYPDIPQKTTIEALIMPDKKVIYGRSSLIPYLVKEDTNKWLKFILSEEVVKDLSPGQIGKQESQKELVPYKALLKKIVIDDGIFRKKGEALAQYEITATPASLRTLAADPELKDLQPVLLSLADDKTSLHSSFWVEPVSARLRYVELTSSVNPGGVGVDVSFQLSQEIRYTLTGPITEPAIAEQVVTPGGTYLTQVSEQLTNNIVAVGEGVSAPLVSEEISSSRNKAHNSSRKEDISEFAKAIEMYRNDDGNNDKYPSTGGKVEYLDDPNASITKLGSKLVYKLPTKDPLPEKYHYQYVSDGTHYAVATIITSDTDSNVVVATYGVKDGTVFNKPFPAKK